MEFSTYTLPNGIRGIHRQVRNTVAHCALVIGAGSRDEHPAEYGLAHLTEHAFFKGTERRKAWQVNCRLENLGGELNAFTTKEDTTIHATTLCAVFHDTIIQRRNGKSVHDITHHLPYRSRARCSFLS